MTYVEIKEGAEVRITVDIPLICWAGQTGIVDEYPYGVDVDFAFVRFDFPKFDRNGYAFMLCELEKPNG